MFLGSLLGPTLVPPLGVRCDKEAPPGKKWAREHRDAGGIGGRVHGGAHHPDLNDRTTELEYDYLPSAPPLRTLFGHEVLVQNTPSSESPHTPRVVFFANVYPCPEFRIVR